MAEKDAWNWNYVVTVHKSNNVTHSCVCNLTGPREQHLIIVNCSRLEIHSITPQNDIQSMLDVPIYGRITILGLYRPPGEVRDFPFIVTDRYKFCVLAWDPDASQLVTRESIENVSLPHRQPTGNGQIGVVDPDCRLIGLYLYVGLFMVILLDNNGKLKKEFNIRLTELDVLDIKFLAGCSRPTIAVLYQDNNHARHVKTYVVPLEEGGFVKGPWSLNNLDKGAHLLIPVPQPLCGLIIVAENKIVLCSSTTYKAISIKPSIMKTYATVEPSRYLLADYAGQLHLLHITLEKEKVTGLKISCLGETSVASTVSFLGNNYVYVGSTCGDPQLVKGNIRPDAEPLELEVLKTYVNFGPIVDFCVVDLDGRGKSQVVTCSGALKDARLRVFTNGLRVEEEVALGKLDLITQMWSAGWNENCNSILTITFLGDYSRIYEVNILEEKLLELSETAFNSDTTTLFCCEAGPKQLIQVTTGSVRLVSLTEGLLDEWTPLTAALISVGAANATQVLLTYHPKMLVYLEIRDRKFVQVTERQLDYQVSCLSLQPVGENSDDRQFAAVGFHHELTWDSVEVEVINIPDLVTTLKEELPSISIRSALLSSLEGILYLFCGLIGGELVTLVLNSDGTLRDREVVGLGTKPFGLQTFESSDSKCVFVTCDQPIIIYSMKGILQYCYVNLDEVRFMCALNNALLPNRFVCELEDENTGMFLYKIDDFKNPEIRSFPSPLKHAQQICHQEQSHTFAICTLKYKRASAENSEMHSIHLLDEQTFKSISSYPLHTYECACSIISCSFSDDNTAYYCVGTAYVLPGEEEPTKGRIIIFTVEDRKLKLIAEKETEVGVYALKAFHGKLLAGINGLIQLYKWVPAHKLELECECAVRVQSLYLQTRGYYILVGDLMMSMTLLIYKHEEGEIKQLGWDYNRNWMSAIEILDDNFYVGAANNCNIFTLRKNDECHEISGEFRVVGLDAIPMCYLVHEVPGQLDVVGEYHLGYLVNQFKRGSLTRCDKSIVDEHSTILYGTTSGDIGIIASLSYDQYVLLEKLQTSLRKIRLSVGDLSHQEWRSTHYAPFERIRHKKWLDKPQKYKPTPEELAMFDTQKEIFPARNFLDGDLIETFLELDPSRMQQVSEDSGLRVEEVLSTLESVRRKVRWS